MYIQYLEGVVGVHVCADACGAVVHIFAQGCDGSMCSNSCLLYTSVMLHFLCRTTDPVGTGLNAVKLDTKGPKANDSDSDGARQAKIRKVLASADVATSQGAGLKGSVRVSQDPKVFAVALNMAAAPVMHMDHDAGIDQTGKPSHADVHPDKGQCKIGADKATPHEGQLTPKGAMNGSLTLSSKLSRSGTNKSTQVMCASGSIGSVTAANEATEAFHEAQQLKVCRMICCIQSCAHHHAYCNCIRTAL